MQNKTVTTTSGWIITGSGNDYGNCSGMRDRIGCAILEGQQQQQYKENSEQCKRES